MVQINLNILYGVLNKSHLFAMFVNSNVMSLLNQFHQNSKLIAQHNCMNNPKHVTKIITSHAILKLLEACFKLWIWQVWPAKWTAFGVFTSCFLHLKIVMDLICITNYILYSISNNLMIQKMTYFLLFLTSHTEWSWIWCAWIPHTLFNFERKKF